jgi:hypothetical protein
MNSQKNVTYLENLPELEDSDTRSVINSGMKNQYQHNNFQDTSDKIRKFIRPNMGPPHSQSGMNIYQHREQSEHQFEPRSDQPFFQPPQKFQQEPTYKQVSDSPNCLQIHDHVQNCPICSKFFKHNNVVYIITITVLSIICILLLKRVLNL